MGNTVYVCRSCGYVFAQELSELIESNVQVYCEMCGTPFSLAGVEFKKAPTRFSQPGHPSNQAYMIKEKSKAKFANAIKLLNKFDDVPLIIFAVLLVIFLATAIFFPGWSLNYMIGQTFLLITVILILIYDYKYISPRIKSDGLNSIALDAFCYGILGCIIYGLGVIILIKGILIIIYNGIFPDSPKNKFYYFGDRLKNSLNNFSAKAGFIILSLMFYAIFSGIFVNDLITIVWNFFDNIIIETDIWTIIADRAIIIVGFSLFPSIILLIDFRVQRKIYDTTDLNVGHAIGLFILGAIGTSLFSCGIFILLKGILLFFLVVAKPIDYKKAIKEEKPQILRPVSTSHKIEPKIMKLYEYKDSVPSSEREESKVEESIIIKTELDLGKVKPTLEKEIIKQEVKEEYEIPQKEQEIIQQEDSKKVEAIYEPKLHESLLPVKDEKDKALVKQYFSKIFNVLSKDLREKVKELDIPKQDRKEILKELSFLTQEEQNKHLELLKELYKEFPKKLIERIRQLKNVKPEHYDKIIDQLKYMDSTEQLEFVQFLENNT